MNLQYTERKAKKQCVNIYMRKYILDLLMSCLFLNKGISGLVSRELIILTLQMNTSLA